MCRFLVFRGSDEVLLSKLILDPTHSILKQSFDSRLRLDTRRGQNNADGFGIGFYTDPKLGSHPCLFKSTIPAWNCTNLQRIATKTASQLVFAHVRATTEGSLSEDNCHPFYCGSLMFMHNGGLGGWKYIKRRLAERLYDRWYLFVQGGTDSEWAFALFLDRLERLGVDPTSEPKKGFDSGLLRQALLQTIDIINELTTSIPESVVQSEMIDTRSLLNFAVTDGHNIICTRYVSSKTDEAASLYYSSGTQWNLRPAPVDKDYQMERQDKAADVALVASEPLTFERENWVNVPTNSMVVIDGTAVTVHPIEDAFSDTDPYNRRSSAFVVRKGLTTNEKEAAQRAISPLATPNTQDTDLRRFINPQSTLPIRSRTLESGISLSSVSSRIKTPLSHCETISASDIRSVTDFNSQRLEVSTKQPSMGNIKKKRRSLLAGEFPHPAEHVDAEGQPQTPDSPVLSPTRASQYVDNEKAARVLGLAL